MQLSNTPHPLYIQTPPFGVPKAKQWGYSRFSEIHEMRQNEKPRKFAPTPISATLAPIGTPRIPAMTVVKIEPTKEHPVPYDTSDDEVPTLPPVCMAGKPLT